MTSQGKTASGVRQETGNGGLPKLVIENKLASGEVYLHGATVTGYRPSGQPPVLFLSKQSMWAHAKAIRGGVPICWPWFGPHPTDPSLPQHGTARLSEWSLVSSENLPDGATRVTLAIDQPSASLKYEVTVGRSLVTRLTTTNRSPSPFTFTQALHTYLAVGDIRQISVEGLAGLKYLSRVLPGSGTQQEPIIRFTGEFDRTFFNTTTPVKVTDPVLKRTLTVTKQGSRSTVVWNPWIDKAKALPDMGDDEWPGFVCIETANAGENAVTIAPGESSAIESRVDMAT